MILQKKKIVYSHGILPRMHVFKLKVGYFCKVLQKENLNVLNILTLFIQIYQWWQ